MRIKKCPLRQRWCGSWQRLSSIPLDKDEGSYELMISELAGHYFRFVFMLAEDWLMPFVILLNDNDQF